MDLTLQRPDPMADFTVGAGFLLQRGTESGVAARLAIHRPLPLDLSRAAALHLAAWLAAYAEDCSHDAG